MMRAAQALYARRQATAKAIDNDPISQGARNFAKDMPVAQQYAAGMGKAFGDIGDAGAQLVGSGPTAEQVQESRRLDAPLMRTGAGVAGNISGNIAAMAPLAVVPGANTVAGAGALGTMAAALQPATGVQERVTNMAVGGGLGAGTQALAGPVAQRVGQWGAEREAQAAQRQSQNTVRDQTLSDAQAAGYGVPASAVNPSWLNRRLESVSGKAAVGQQFAVQNNEVTDALARRAATLRPDEPLSEASLSTARHRAAQPYRDIAAINQQAAADLDAWKAANLEAKLQWNHYNRAGDPAAYRAAQAAESQSAQLLTNIDQAAQQTGNQQLVDALRQARVQIAKIHNVENAVNRGTGSVDASVLGRALDNGAPLSDELRTIASFQQAFPQYAREASRVPTPGVSKSEALSAALLGAVGGWPAAALPLLSGPTRALVTSRPYQNAMAQPNYSSGMATRGAAALADPATRDRAAILARALALPAIPMATPSN